MKNKYIEPLISILIICAVFTAVIFVIIEAEKVFNKQVSASVSESIILEPREEMSKLLTDRTKEQLETIIFSECLNKAYKTFEQNWNEECSKLELEEKCSLPRYLADGLQQGYQKAKEACQTE
jgi:flagellar biosynthesis/type III secretory pathway protein FliH